MPAVRFRGPATLVEVTVDGATLRLAEGEPLATALAVAGVHLLRQSPRARSPRGAFCFMGACQECVIFIDGEMQQACLTPVSAGLVVELRGAP